MSYNRNKYKIILFKNNERVKSFFSSNNKKSILEKYNKLIGEKKPKFIIEYISRKKVMFELAIITTETSKESIFVKDELGRTKKIYMGNSEYNIIKLLPYWREEYVYDHHTKTKISFENLINTYMLDKEFKQVFTLNNKLIIQKENVFNVFSLKTISDSLRLLRIIELEFLNIGRYDCLFVEDTNTVQRKQLYDLLVNNGYGRAFLRKQYTY
tara:strand:+ start:1249 stop:1884 length:636 start_codon:yes stop_codon:yes gene_type:complete